MKKKENPNHISSFRCEFNAENTNDKIMIEKILHLRHITQFNNKQLLNFLLCLGDDTIGSCQTFSDLLGMFSMKQKQEMPKIRTEHPAEPATLPHPAPADTGTAPPSRTPDTALDDLFQNEDDPETEKMIADMLNL